MRRIWYLAALFSLCPLASALASWPPALILESNVKAGYAMAIDQDGELFTISPGERGAYYVTKYTASGTLVRTTLTGDGGSFRAPEALAVDAEGKVYIADTYASRIQIFDNDLIPVATWVREGWIDYPRDIEIGGDRVYVKTSTEVQIFDLNGEALARWPAPGWIFTVESSGNILTAEQGMFHRFDVNGTLLADMPGNYPFSYPTGFIAYEHVLLVATGESPLMAFDENGAYRDSFSPAGGATFLAKGPHGEIYVDGLTHYEAPGDLLPPPPPPPPTTGASAVMLHISPVKDPDVACQEGPHSTDEIVTQAAARSDGTAQYFVYVLAAPRSSQEGIRGVQLGIEHSGSTTAPTDLRITDWRTCSDAEWPDDTWPNSGGGNTLTWISCQFHSIVTVGTFAVTAYAPSSMAITGYPATGLVKTADCNAAEEVTSETIGFDRVGWVSMGGAARGLDRDGCNPALESCIAQQVPVQNSTWGRLKALYGNH